MSASDHLQACSGGKSLVCFYHEYGPNRSRAGGRTERNCFPYTRRVRLEPAAPLAAKWRFQGGFPSTRDWLIRRSMMIAAANLPLAVLGPPVLDWAATGGANPTRSGANREAVEGAGMSGEADPGGIIFRRRHAIGPAPARFGRPKEPARSFFWSAGEPNITLQ